MKVYGLLFVAALFITCKNAEETTLPKVKTNQIHPEVKSVTRTSTTFFVNKIACFWTDSITSRGTIMLRLLDKKSGKVLLTHDDITQNELDDYKNSIVPNESLNEYFKDANFDDNLDFVIYSRQNSGSGGAFYDVYLFDCKTNQFYYSEEISGGEIELDPTKKTVSTFWKSGVSWNNSQTHYFGQRGKIKYTEQTTREMFYSDSLQLLKTTFEKIIDGKVRRTKIDTTVYEGF